MLDFINYPSRASHELFTLWKWEVGVSGAVDWNEKFCAQRAQVFSHKYAIHLWE
jgi:hypothetical protein